MLFLAPQGTALVGGGGCGQGCQGNVQEVSVAPASMKGCSWRGDKGQA